jgi:predicted Zn-dependent peptidase
MANSRALLRRGAGCLLGGALLLLAAGRLQGAETRLFSFTTSKGLAVKVLQDNDLPFIHAELLVYLDGNTQNYQSLAITQLALLDMFERSLNSPPANLMEMLQRQGGDFSVEQNPEFVRIRFNFLPDRLAAFSKLLREIFTYQSFHLGKFNLSRENFWTLFRRGRDWRKEIALMLAYQQLVGNFYFTRGYLLREVLNGINMAQLRSFVLRTFRPDNALLVIKGKINPYLVLGMIEKDLPPPGPRPAQARREPVQVNPGRKVFILNVDTPDPPMVYWFDVAPPAAADAFLPYAIGNFTLFGFPGGRIYQSQRNRFAMEGYKVDTEAIHLKDFTLFCNYVRLNYGDLEDFLLLVDQERKKFSVRPVERKEYLDALNFYVGHALVKTGSPDSDLQPVIDSFHGQVARQDAPRIGPELFQEVSHGRVLQAIDEQMGSKHRNNGRERGIVVLVGDADQILNNLKSLKTEALELSLD